MTFHKEVIYFDYFQYNQQNQDFLSIINQKLLILKDLFIIHFKE